MQLLFVASLRARQSATASAIMQGRADKQLTKSSKTLATTQPSRVIVWPKKPPLLGFVHPHHPRLATDSFLSSFLHGIFPPATPRPTRIRRHPGLPRSISASAGKSRPERCHAAVVRRRHHQSRPAVPCH